MPKIAIDISPTINGNAFRGVGYYTRSLVDALQKEVKINPDYKDFEISLIKNFELKIKNYDLIHYPFFDPYYLTLPAKNIIPTIISIHDLIPRQYKSHYPAGIKGYFKWLIQRYRARQADYLITISHYSKFIIADLLKYPVDQIYVTYLGAEESYQPIKDKNFLAKIKKIYNLPDKYVLYLGDISWNKNIPSLCRACIDLNIPLFISGKQAVEIDALTLQKPSIFRPLDLLRHLLKLPSPELKHITELKSLFSHPLIKRIGYPPDEDLPALFQMATIYCQPSYAEGFGLGVLKAMQMGIPVVYAQETSLPEVMNYSGLFFDPYDPTALTKTLKKLWRDSSLQQELAKKGLLRSKFFSWQKTAIQTLATYKLALLNEK